MNIQKVNQQPQTMSSTELANILPYTKKEVNKKIRAMFGENEAREKFSPTLRANGQVEDYNLPELESKMFVARYDLDYLEQITQFWIDNANKVKEPEVPALPQTYLEALEDLVKTTKEKEQLALENTRLLGVCHTMTKQFETGMSIPEFCKQLNGVNMREVNNALIELNLLQVSKKRIKTTSYTRDLYFKEIPKMYKYECEETGVMKIGSRPKIVVLQNGAKKLYSLYLAGQLPMKVSWNGEYSHMTF